MTSVRTGIKLRDGGFDCGGLITAAYARTFRLGGRRG
jgi:hypothetical protein